MYVLTLSRLTVNMYVYMVPISLQLLEALSSRTAVPTTSNHHNVSKETWSTEVPKDDFTVDYKQHDGVRGQTRGVLAHRRDPPHTAGLKSVAGTRSQLRTCVVTPVLTHLLCSHCTIYTPCVCVHLC